jgi:hypothetical protein
LSRGRIAIYPVNKQAGLKIEMFGLHGQKVLARKVSGFSPVEIDVSAFAKGVYMIRVQGVHSVMSRSVTLF